MANLVNSKETFLEFLVALRSNLDPSRIHNSVSQPSSSDPSYGWENSDLESFLEAMHAWTEDMGDRLPSEPSWQTFAKMLMAATVYE